MAVRLAVADNFTLDRGECLYNVGYKPAEVDLNFRVCHPNKSCLRVCVAARACR